MLQTHLLPELPAAAQECLNKKAVCLYSLHYCLARNDRVPQHVTPIFRCEQQRTCVCSSRRRAWGSSAAASLPASRKAAASKASMPARKAPKRVSAVPGPARRAEVPLGVPALQRHVCSKV